MFDRFRGRQRVRRALERTLLRAAAQAPDFLEEIRAMAEGAGVTFSDLFRLNLTELHTYADKCTTVIVPVHSPGGRSILIGHNEDWDPKRNDVFILRAHLPELSYVVLSYDGYLPGLSSGRNSFGLCHAINYLRPRDQRIGLPRIFITRFLVTAPNIQACLKWMTHHPRAFGQGIHMAQGGRYCGIELTAKRHVLWRPCLPAVHTNHYLCRRLRPQWTNAGLSSRVRLRAARRILGKARAVKTLSQARRLVCHLLADQSALPYPIWRDGLNAEDPGATVASTIFATQSDALTVYRDRPDRSRPLTVTCPARL